MLNFLLSLILIIGEISQQTHIMSFAFCPVIFGGSAIFAIVMWVRVDKSKRKEIIWSISVIIMAILVLVFVGLNTFLWLNDLLFYIFIAVRFTLLIFLIILANPYIKWAPFKGIFKTKEISE